MRKSSSTYVQLASGTFLSKESIRLSSCRPGDSTGEEGAPIPLVSDGDTWQWDFAVELTYIPLRGSSPHLTSFAVRCHNNTIHKAASNSSNPFLATLISYPPTTTATATTTMGIKGLAKLLSDEAPDVRTEKRCHFLALSLSTRFSLTDSFSSLSLVDPRSPSAEFAWPQDCHWCFHGNLPVSHCRSECRWHFHRCHHVDQCRWWNHVSHSRNV